MKPLEIFGLFTMCCTVGILTYCTCISVRNFAQLKSVDNNLAEVSKVNKKFISVDLMIIELSQKVKECEIK